MSTNIQYEKLELVYGLILTKKCIIHAMLTYTYIVKQYIALSQKKHYVHITSFHYSNNSYSNNTFVSTY